MQLLMQPLHGNARVLRDHQKAHEHADISIFVHSCNDAKAAAERRPLVTYQHFVAVIKHTCTTPAEQALQAALKARRQ